MSSESELKQCAACGARDHLRQCARCKRAWYCGDGHQKEHWPTHKRRCVKAELVAMQAFFPALTGLAHLNVGAPPRLPLFRPGCAAPQHGPLPDRRPTALQYSMPFNPACRYKVEYMELEGQVGQRPPAPPAVMHVRLRGPPPPDASTLPPQDPRAQQLVIDFVASVNSARGGS